MTWTGQTFNVGQTLTAAQMTNLQADITAVMNGDSNAPRMQTAGIATGAITIAKMSLNSVGTSELTINAVTLVKMSNSSVDTAELVAAAVGRSQIANSTTTSAGTITSNNFRDFNLNDWALFPMIHVSGAGTPRLLPTGTDGGSAAAPRFAIRNLSGDSVAYDVDHRWIIAA